MSKAAVIARIDWISLKILISYACVPSVDPNRDCKNRRGNIFSILRKAFLLGESVSKMEKIFPSRLSALKKVNAFPAAIKNEIIQTSFHAGSPIYQWTKAHILREAGRIHHWKRGILDMNRTIRLPGIIMLILSICGCFSPYPGRYMPAAPPEAIKALEDTLARINGDGSERTIRELESLVDRYPDFVEAHRHLQNLYMWENRYGYLMGRYGNAVRREPGSAANNYLYGRLFSDPEKQMEAFSDAVGLDASFFWGYNGLGYAQRSVGHFSDSEAAFQKALETAPSRVEPYHGLISLYLAARKYEQAERLLAKALERFPSDLSIHLLRFRLLAKTEGPLKTLQAQLEIPPQVKLEADFFLLLLRTFDEASSEFLARRILYKFGPMAEGNDPFNGALDLLLGICCRRLGNLTGALRHLSRVRSVSPADGRVRRELRYIYTVAGRLEEALALQIEDCPREWIEGSRYGDYRERILELGQGLKGGAEIRAREEEALELASLLSDLGWLDEAIHFLNLLADSPSETGGSAAALLDEIYRHLNFELALRDFFLTQYKDYKSEGFSLGRKEVMEMLSGISLEILGRDIFEHASFLDFSPAGELMDIRPSVPPGPADYFRRFNRFFLLGRKTGGIVEAYLLDVFDLRPGQVREFAGDRIEFDLIRCENLRIPSYIEFEGGNIAGAGLHSLLFVNMDFLRREVQRAVEIYERFRGEEGTLLEDPAPAALESDDALDVSEGYGLSTRLSYLSYKRSRSEGGKTAYMASLFNVLKQHEFQHLLDARRFLPLSKHLAWKVYHIVIRGFSRFSIEAWLEERAQLFALHYSTDPLAVLGEIADYLRGPVFRSPHQKGYRNLMRRIVEHIFDHPNRFPQIDREASLVHQLHRLSEEEIREIARTLIVEEGLTEPL